METNFEALKEELNSKVKTENPCSSEYRRFLKSENEEQLLKVIYDNLNWCLDHKVLSHQYFSNFNQDLYLNSGIANAGLENTGFSNSGNSNSGNWNSGNRNSGDSNSGYRNSGYRNSGAFCTDTNPTLILFNKPTTIPVKDLERSKAVEIMYNIETTLWVPFSSMNESEKSNNPNAETTEGYLKTIPIKEALANAWNNWSEDYRKVFLDLPNFDSKIFEEITGIKTK